MIETKETKRTSSQENLFILDKGEEEALQRMEQKIAQGWVKQGKKDTSYIMGDYVLPPKKGKGFRAVLGQPKLLVMEFNDEVATDDGKRTQVVPGLGKINAEINDMLFELIRSRQFSTSQKIPIKSHYLGRSLNHPEMCLVERIVEPVMLELLVRNRAYGSLAKRFGLEEGTELSRPIYEFTLKDNSLGDPMVNSSHIRAFGLADKIEIERMREIGLQVNQIMRAFFNAVGLDLGDCKLVFGRSAVADGKGVRDGHSLRLIGELSPNIARVVDLKTGKVLGKEEFCRGQAGSESLLAAYQQVREMLNERDHELAETRRKQQVASANPDITN